MGGDIRNRLFVRLRKAFRDKKDYDKFFGWDRGNLFRKSSGICC